MQLREIILDQSLRELTVRGEPGYPLAMYDNDMAGFLGGTVPWHWHREIELLWVYEGAMNLETEGTTQHLEPGQGAFLNSGVLHRMYRSTGSVCKMVTVVFDPQLIAGGKTTLLYSKYVLPLIQCRAIPMVPLTGVQEWQQKALESLWRAFDHYHSAAFERELSMCLELTEIWMLLLQEYGPVLEQSPVGVQDQRLKQMLGYLQEHLAEPLRLVDVAAAANISARECTRCFRQTLETSPMAYLTQLRVRAAAAMLEQTREPVTQIGMTVGFSSPSYFGKVFREQTGLSPSAYRRAGEGK